MSAATTALPPTAAERLPYRVDCKPLPLGLKVKSAVADKLVFSKIQVRTGGRMKYFVSGGAPLSPEINKFFYAAGLLILEGYGLTETVAPVSDNRPDDFKFGTVGRLIEGIEAKLGEENELLLRGQGLELPLGAGEITKKLTVTAHAFSASAKEKIEKLGGTCEVITKAVTPAKA